MKNKLEKIKYVLEQIKHTHLAEYTTSCAYFTILSFIPLVMLIITLTKYLGIDGDSIGMSFNGIISNSLLNNIIKQIVEEVYSKSVGTITISALFTLWTAGKGFFALCKGLNAAYQIKDNRSYWFFRIRGIICTIIFISVIILTLLLLVFGNRIYNLLVGKSTAVNGIIHILFKSKFIIIAIILFAIFLMMYRFIPKHKYKMKHHIPGAILASLLCIISSLFFAIYVNIFTGFSYIYGSLTSIILAMMWVYACMYSILLGAFFNNEIIKKNKKDISKI